MGKLPVWVGCLYRFAGPDAKNIKMYIDKLHQDRQTDGQRGLSLDIVMESSMFVDFVGYPYP